MTMAPVRKVTLQLPEPIEDPLWRVEVEGFDPLREREVEAWFTVANGRTGTRGSLEEGSEESAPATYVAGVFGRALDDPAAPVLVRGPEWTALAPRAGDELLDLDQGRTLEHLRILDLRRATLYRAWRQRLPSGREVSFASARFASLAERDLMVLQSSAGPGVRLSDGIRVPGPVSTVEVGHEGDRTFLTFRGRKGGVGSFAVSTREADGSVARIVAVDRQQEPADPATSLDRALRGGCRGLWERHVAAWSDRWNGADVEVEGDPESQRALRFALYHLISAGDPESDEASIGARGLTGPGYRGHVFWDTEAFMLPFFVFTHPPTARALLAYRYRTLPAARAKAASAGYRGALYAWESADTGEEVTPAFGFGPEGERVPILTGEQEHHISADVAWAVWRYWQATRDEGFMADMGAEMILETARLWASRARRGRDGSFHVADVIGPDEYHEGVLDNAFTNAMARWNLERGLEVAELLGRAGLPARREVRRRVGLRSVELRRWERIAAGLVDGFDPGTTLYEQFAGFFDLEDVVGADVAPRPFAGDAILGRDRVRRSQVVKQADVLMLAHMLPELMAPEVVRANYRYYEPRTTHGSSLSPAIHASVAARIGEPEDAAAYFRMAAAIDLDDRMGNAALGIHMATMGGLWQAAVVGFGGLTASDDGVRFDPRLPAGWDRLAFPLRWRGTTIRVEARPGAITLDLDGPARAAVGSRTFRGLSAGRYAAAARGGRWSGLEEVRPS